MANPILLNIIGFSAQHMKVKLGSLVITYQSHSKTRSLRIGKVFLKISNSSLGGEITRFKTHQLQRDRQIKFSLFVL